MVGDLKFIFFSICILNYKTLTSIYFINIGVIISYPVGKYEGFIFGAPTWHTNADSERSGTSWDSWLYDDIKSYDFTNKPIALFGVGDASSYSSNFCDAMGELYDCFLAAGAKFYGATSTDVIEFDDSKAIRDGKFVGMVFDEDNESELSEGRAKNWIAALKSEGFPI